MNEDKYSKIEEIFSIFSKSELDEFENVFLNYSKSNLKIQKDLFKKHVILDTKSTILSLLNSKEADFLGTNQIGSPTQIISIGNPKKYDERIFSSVSSNPLLNTQPTETYIEGSLPTSGEIGRAHV